MELVPAGSEILKTKTERFDFKNPPTNPVELYQNLANMMLEHDGVGLAAVQLGLPYRVFVMHSDPIKGCFNPIIVDASIETLKLDESCLTYPDIVLKVARPRKIRMRYTDAKGQTTTEIFHDLTAKIIQHEVMHCDGKLFGDMVSRLELEMAIKKANKRGHNYKISDLRS